MNILKLGQKSAAVKKWQYFLIGQELYTGVTDGIFGQLTYVATLSFQKKHKLATDGIVGNKTLGVALSLGFGIVIDTFDENDETSENFPAKPDFNSLTLKEKEAKFDVIKWKHKGDGSSVIITNDWESRNMKTIIVPQLSRFKENDKLYFHKDGELQMMKLWQDWDNAGLIPLILSWDGAFNPRVVRGTKNTLSPHAFGIAFDINCAWNKLGCVPALTGQKGSVRKLVQIANNNGFYWGGHFSRKDGMHFEIAK
jgi:Putative peptidoglycan-binding domain-containing protein